jgi:archaellum component FlaD/FlaE
MSEKTQEEKKAEAAQAQPTAQTISKPKIEVDADEYARLLEEIKKRDKQIAAYKMREKNPKITQQPLTTEKKPSETQEHKHEEHKEEETSKPPHFVGSWERFCPECGLENPEFKDETKCKDCSMHLGSAASVEKLKACPNCGGKHAVPL